MVSPLSLSAVSLLGLVSMAMAAPAEKENGKTNQQNTQQTNAKQLPPPGKCKLYWDGRIPKSTPLTQLDTKNPWFNPDYTKNKETKWSSILKVAPGDAAFSSGDSENLEVHITQKSIFAPKPDNVQNGFRRAELMASQASDKDVGFTSGIKTYHFSFSRTKLDLLLDKHEYALWWIEDSTFSFGQITLATGSLIGDRNKKPKPDGEVLYLLGNSKDATDPLTPIWKGPFTKDKFHNFAITLDFDKNTVNVAYSTGKDPLKTVVTDAKNSNAGGGASHIGILKKGLVRSDDVLKDLPRKAYFPADAFDEAIVFSGIFVEDSTDKCVTLVPSKS